METTNNKTVYLAGGCFWGLERLFQVITGVTATSCGYANGSCAEDANYETVCRGKAGFREAVKVCYDPLLVSLDSLLYAFYYVIDPTVKDRQGADIGSQYQTGIYYTDEETKKTAERISERFRKIYSNFAVEILPLKNYFEAEDYHQSYLIKNPGGYCHISPTKIRAFANMRIDAGKYLPPDPDEIKKMLTNAQFAVTQHDSTEPPFSNEYYLEDRSGIYVDVVTGEPLFSSDDKFPSSCGWPAFSKPIEAPVVFNKTDRSHGMYRTEVRSRSGNSHLGHVFMNDPESPNGIRYCINSASLKFIPEEDMEKAGYGYLLPLGKKN